MNRRSFLKETVIATAAAAGLASMPEWMKTTEAAGNGLPFEQGKYQTFPRIKVGGVLATQDIDLGTLGPDVDTIAGFDFLGNIQTGAKVIFTPADGNILETRVVFLKRVDLETVQIADAIGGDRFDMHKVSEFGIDNGALANILELHAKNTARAHQKVVLLGDLGAFEKQYGANERPLLNRIIRAQRPGIAAIGINEPNFVNPRVY